jgi:hypothetical protein
VARAPVVWKVLMVLLRKNGPQCVRAGGNLDG